MDNKIGTKVFVYPIHGSRPIIHKLLYKDEHGFFIHYYGKKYVKPIGEGTFKIQPFEWK